MIEEWKEKMNKNEKEREEEKKGKRRKKNAEKCGKLKRDWEKKSIVI